MQINNLKVAFDEVLKYWQKTNLVKETCELNIRAPYLHFVEGFCTWLYVRVRMCIIYISLESIDSLEYTVIFSKHHDI